MYVVKHLSYDFGADVQPKRVQKVPQLGHITTMDVSFLTLLNSHNKIIFQLIAVNAYHSFLTK